MTPKQDVVMLYKNNEDNIISIINVKDLILPHNEANKLELIDIIRPVSIIKHNEKIDDVFRYMQDKNKSLYVVYKNKKFIGIVTIEDVVDEIVGNIYDEYDNILS